MSQSARALLERFGYADYPAYTSAQRERSLVNLAHDPSRRVAHLAGFLGAVAGGARGAVLCVGCRNTTELGVLEGRGWSPVIGIDLHAQASERIRVMDMHRLEFDAGTFAAVFASHALEHALEPEVVAAEMVRVARPGGLLAIEVPIRYGGRGADLWDFASAAGVAERFPGCAIEHAEEGEQLDAKQQVARVVLRTPA